MSQSSSGDRMIDLLIARAICGLNPSEERSLAELQFQRGVEDDRSWDQTVAIIDKAMTGDDMSQLPDPIRSRVVSDAQQYLLKSRAEESRAEHFQTGRPSKHMGTREMVAWLALAASLLIMAMLWFIGPAKPQPLSLAKLQTLSDVKRIELKPTEDPSAEKVRSAQVIWSDSAQQGFVISRGLAVNDPTVERYQLWVIDRKRGFAQRVDGGVFDVASNADEVVVRVDAKLKVFDAKGFAVTREIPEGVVESDLQRVALISENVAD